MRCIMGSQRYYEPMGGLSKYFYKDDSRFEPVTINGVSAKVITKKKATIKDTLVCQRFRTHLICTSRQDVMAK